MVAALVAVAALWGWREYNDRAVAKASQTYAQAMDAFAQGRDDQALSGWQEVAKSPAKAYKSLALMQMAGIKVTEKKPAEAVALFDQAADAAPDAILQDAARLKSAFTLLDTAPYKDVEQRLTPLMKDGRPYRVQAREALAFAKLI